jgi:hypothetical protein
VYLVLQLGALPHDVRPAQYLPPQRAGGRIRQPHGRQAVRGQGTCAVPRLFSVVELGLWRRQPCSWVFADQAADGLPQLDPGGEIDEFAGLALRRQLAARLVRPVAVVMPRILRQDRCLPWSRRPCGGEWW